MFHNCKMILSSWSLFHLRTRERWIILTENWMKRLLMIYCNFTVKVSMLWLLSTGRCMWCVCVSCLHYINNNNKKENHSACFQLDLFMTVIFLSIHVFFSLYIQGMRSIVRLPIHLLIVRVASKEKEKKRKTKWKLDAFFIRS